ncbi:MAG TPA: T9SS type A sorting domain-containing protein [Puia sp.]|nr:T9SS type A sorting domain-containing protein [Puia sp.]
MRRRTSSVLKKVGLAMCIGMLSHGNSSAQCINNMGTRTYDTTLTNNGFGNYNLSFPQWSPDSGQLVSVKLTANVTSTYGYNLRNVTASPATYMVNIGQEDQISAAFGAPFTSLTPQYVGTYTLQAGESQLVAPFPFLTNHISSDSLTGNVATFLGNSSVNINYLSFTYTNLVAYNNASYYYSNTINTTTQFSVQYLYCQAGVVLAANLTRWTATLTAPSTVELDFTAVNEVAGRRYEIQRSSDGHSFTTIATQTATSDGLTADYTYTDHLPTGAGGKWYYRLQVVDNGTFSWSAVREIDVNAMEKNLRIYPNPATDHIDIATGTANSDWQTDILSASGMLVQRETLLNSGLLHIPFRNRLSAGTYFVRITDLRAQKTQVSSFIVNPAN